MNAFPPPTSAPAGWYPDPTGVGYRYFDGRAWGPPAPVFEQRPPHPRLPIQAALGALVILVVSLIVGKATIELLIDFDWPIVVYVVMLATIGYGPSLVWAWYVRGRWGDRRAAELGWRFSWQDLWTGPVTYLVAIGCQIAVAALVMVLEVPITSNVEDASDFGADRAYIVVTVITAVVAAPLVEELVFRGVVLRGFLSKLSPVMAIGLQGVLFGAAHIDPVRGVGNVGLAIVLSSVGIALGGAAYLMRRIGPTIIAHAIFNGVVMIIVLTGVLDRIDRELGGVLAFVSAV